MSSATVAALNAVMRMDSGQFTSGTKQAQDALKGLEDQSRKTSQQLVDQGKSLTTKLTVPIVGAGTAAVAMSMKYEESFAQMQGLAGTTTAEVTEFKGAIDQLGPAAGKGPQELADALYFIASAGFHGKDALEIMTVSAKASAAGLGETKQIADLTTSAMSAYAKSGLTAADATDILVAAVRDGKAEPDEMANALGRVIPLAASMGVTFDQVAGATAALTAGGLDTNEAVTALSGILRQIADPSDQAREALQGLNLDAAGLRQMIAEQGLLPALQALSSGFADNSEGATALFGDVRGLTGYLSLMGQDTSKIADIFNDTANAAGSVDQAFSVMSKTAGFQAKQAFANLQKDGIIVGDIMLPKIASMANKASGALQGFASAPPAFQQLTVNLLGGAAAAGPVMVIMGKPAPLANSVGSAVTGMAGAFKGSNMSTFGMDAEKAAEANAKVEQRSQAVKSAVAGAGGAIAAGMAVWAAWTSMMDAAADSGKKVVDDALGPFNEKLNAGKVNISDAEAKIGRLNDAIAQNGQEMDNTSSIIDIDYKNALLGANTEMQKQTADMQRNIDTAKVLASATGASADEMFAFLNTVKGGAGAFKTTQEAVDAYKQSQLTNMGVTDAHGVKVDELTGKYADEAIATEKAKAALNEWADAVNAQFDPLLGYTGAVDGLKGAQLQVTEAQTALTTAQREHGYASIEAQQATLQLSQAEDGLLKANVDLDVAGRKLTQGVKDGTVNVNEAKAAVDSWTASGRISATQAETIKKRLDDATVSAQVLDAQSPLISVSADTGKALFDLAAVKAKIDEIMGAGYAAKMSVGVEAAKAAMSKINGAASGTGPSGMPNGLTLVGEEGPELLSKQGARVDVLSGPKTRTALSGGFGGGGGVHIGNITYQAAPGESRSDRRRNAAELVEMIRDYEREHPAS